MSLTKGQKRFVVCAAIFVLAAFTLCCRDAVRAEDTWVSHTYKDDTSIRNTLLNQQGAETATPSTSSLQKIEYKQPAPIPLAPGRVPIQPSMKSSVAGELLKQQRIQLEPIPLAPGRVPIQPSTKPSVAESLLKQQRVEVEPIKLAPGEVPTELLKQPSSSENILRHQRIKVEPIKLAPGEVPTMQLKDSSASDGNIMRRWQRK